MSLTMTTEELQDELQALATDLLIDLLEIEMLLRYPVDPTDDNSIYRAAVSRTGCFLEQHSAEVASIGKFLLERTQKSTVSN